MSQTRLIKDPKMGGELNCEICNSVASGPKQADPKSMQNSGLVASL